MNKKQLIAGLAIGIILLPICAMAQPDTLLQLVLSAQEDRINKYLAKHKDTPKEIKEKMLNHQVAVGMNKEQVDLP